MSTARDHQPALEELQIAEVSDRTGLTAHTLRYYERAGLVLPVRRDAGGRRRYAAADMEWLAFLLRLRDTGMSIAGMKQFATLRAQGSSTLTARLALLGAHYDEVEQRVAELQENLSHLASKIDHYQDLLGQAEKERTP